MVHGWQHQNAVFHFGLLSLYNSGQWALGERQTSVLSLGTHPRNYWPGLWLPLPVGDWVSTTHRHRPPPIHTSIRSLSDNTRTQRNTSSVQTCCNLQMYLLFGSAHQAHDFSHFLAVYFVVLLVVVTQTAGEHFPATRTLQRESIVGAKPGPCERQQHTSP